LAVYARVKEGVYFDSIKLMSVASELRHLPGVVDSAVVMATAANKAILQTAELLTPAAADAAPNDLIIAVKTDLAGAEAAAALDRAEALLHAGQRAGGAAQELRPKTLRGALKSYPQANVVVISVAGRYAVDEAWEALRRGLHVLLFSDNVALEDEIALKTYANAQGLLLMGPGAGTTILNGAALGFANVLPAGPIGIVSAAGTGLQEVSTLLARRGVGVTQGLGVGGRDLSAAVGGRMFLAALAALQADPATEILVLVSKPPAPAVAQAVLAQAARSAKPTVICFLGGDAELAADLPHVRCAATLTEAADLAARLAGAESSYSQFDFTQQAADLRARLQPDQRWLRGLFAGGTLCYEAQVVWRDLLAEPVWSNAPLDPARRLDDSAVSRGHTAVDLGEEEFTVGRLHPMLDNALRIRRLLEEARDPQVGVILLDVVLGYGAHPDPAAELAPAVMQAKRSAQANGRELIVIASVTGADADPQNRRRQVERLAAAGVIVCNSNAAAAHLAAQIVNRQSPIVNHQSSIANRQSSIVNRQSSIANRQSSIANRKSSIVNRQS